MWKVGESRKGLTKEGNPATGAPIEFSLTLAKYGLKVPDGHNDPVWGPMFPNGSQTPGWIQVDQVAKDTKLGTVLSKMSHYYVLGVGVVFVQGQFFGTFGVMQLTKHTP